ncbi:hypothetical protein PP175_23120 [Aneurinibacillus sp. Ricciae_BoGa-3]|uniref:hypothetical protein n=1 Tax=Aneurinibacillus sp. Ricciae_BoGa-3 TaxID=3022697 RepID=UPI00233FC38B|nr:hypothetical protein [Aneurinibacillus sp. Ricciae_BoGa-3]WCK54145.1 hypothetical protein PP175_23120 [Aneurinibacillus sp. Ricciae_BoGa-3]
MNRPYVRLLLWYTIGRYPHTNRGYLMYRTQKVPFLASKTTVDALFALNRLSAEVWNRCLDEARAHHLQTGIWIDKSTLQKTVKKQFPMHSQCIQSVCHRYLRARQGAWANLPGLRSAKENRSCC